MNEPTDTHNVVHALFHNTATTLSAISTKSDLCVQAAKLIQDTHAPVIISGVGKSGLIGQKLASTFRSLGRQAFFIHASEASHGDLGCFGDKNIVILISNSGETTELSDIIHFCRAAAHPIIAITAKAQSTLGQAARLVIDFGEVAEADHNQLAPTLSSTLQLVIGDAIAVACAHLSGFTPDHFAYFHPGGLLGKRLKTVRDVMHGEVGLPTIDHNAEMEDVIHTISQGGMGIAILMADDQVRGIITDGDLRRHFRDLGSAKPKDIATSNPKFLTPEASVASAIEFMRAAKISQSLVIDQGQLIGVIHMHDCLG